MNDKEISKSIFSFIQRREHSWEADWIVVNDVLYDDSTKEFIDTFDSDYPHFEILNQGRHVDHYSIKQNTHINIRVSPPRKKICFFAKDLEDLLSTKFSIVPQPADFIISELDFVSWENQPTTYPSISAYLILGELVKKLISVEVFKIKHDNAIFLSFANNSLTFIAQITSEVLSSNYSSIITGSENILAMFSSPLYQQDKCRLLKGQIFSTMESLQKSDRFIIFCNLLEEIASNFSDNYDLFISKFSFQSDQENLMKQQYEYSKQISEILSSIQNKILAIPLSLILSYTQMKTEIIDRPFLINSFVVLGSLIFTFLVWKLLGSQEEMLKLISSEFDFKRKRIIKEIPLLFKKMERGFETIDQQIERTNQMLLFLKVLTIIGSFITFCFYFTLTPQVNTFIRLLFNYFYTQILGLP